MPFADKAFRIAQRQAIQPLLIFFTEVNSHFFDRRQDDEHIRVDHLCQAGTGPVLIDHRAGPPQMVAFANYRNTASAHGNNHLSGLNQRLDGFFLNDVHRLRRGHDTTITTSGIFSKRITLFFQLFRFLLCEE
ncbi:hypothetical protein SDC9_188158 [bioreactor metagenome]|uniref:Uncharacterized protein n=1 Tax=bioreactor metagenome TaxID=1076179 RepID=A0A645HP54_9ZZZZ